jgi:hypothetical protein
MPVKSIPCLGFPGFQDPKNRYRVATVSDYDDCPYPNGTLVLEWKECCKPTVTSSIDASEPPDPTGGYAGYVVDDKVSPSFISPFGTIFSDTYCGAPGCSDEGDESIKVSITLSDKIEPTPAEQ